MGPFSRLKVWQAAHELVMDVYRTSRTFPANERFGLTMQVRRSASSVAANIAEGSRSRHRADFARILNIADRETSETTYHLFLARQLGYLDRPAADRLLARADIVARMLNGLYRRVSSGS